MTLYHKFAYKIALPILDLATNKKTSKYLDFLVKSQFWSPSELREFQNERLRKLVKHAYCNVPFYKEIFDQRGLKPSDFKETGDIGMLPILSKEDIRNGIKQSKLLDQSISKKNLVSNCSSGSTGEPLQFYLNKDAASIKKAVAIRDWQWMGFHIGDSILRISPLKRTEKIKHLQDLVTRTRYLQVYKLNDSEFKFVVEEMLKFSPKILRSYPETLYLLTKFMDRNSVKPPKIMAINTTGSTLFDHYRAYIEDFFSCRIFDSFSCEGGPGACQCSDSTYYHVADEYAYIEVVDGEGKPAQKGRLITTDLWNYATPFIRYDTQDVIEMAEEPCICKRGLRSIKKIYGRSSDILITPEKQYLFANNFTGHFQNYPGIDQYQIYQNDVDNLILRLKVNKEYSKKTSESIMELFSEITGGSMNTQIQFVNEIPLAPSGKRRFLIRDESVPLDI